jgi:ribosomal protein L29
MNLRFQQATGELTDYSRLRHSRRDIARLYSILRELEQAEIVEGEK